MAEARLRAGVATLLFIIASFSPIFNYNTLDGDKSFFTSENISTEVRIHDTGSGWNDSEVLIWYPNQPDGERIFQFTIMIDGISNIQQIDYCNLTMTWQYNISSENHLISTSLNKNNFFEINGILWLTYQYPYANNIFFGNYLINLETVDINGINYSFSHQGIEVLERGSTISTIDNFPKDKIIFANGKLTELEFEITNTGVSYSNFDILMTLETNMPSGWNQPLLFNDNYSSLWGGNSISMSISFDAPLDLTSQPPPENITINILISYENDEGEIVELSNDSLLFTSVIVPENSIPYVSFFTDENRTNLIADSLSLEPLDNSVATINGESITLFGNLTNYGFQTSSYEMVIEIVDSSNLWNISVFINDKEVMAGQDSTYSIGTNIEPLEKVYFSIEFNLLGSTFDIQDISIKLTEINNLEDSEILLTFLNYQINNPIIIGNISDQNSTFAIGDILQNESFEFEVLFQLNTYFLTQGFINQWSLELEMENDLAILNSGNVFGYLIQNQSNELPFQFSLNNKLPYTLQVILNEKIDTGNYTIKLTLTQISDDENNSLYFDREISFNVLENISLNVDNDSQSNNSTNNTTNNSTNNTTNNSQNTSGNSDSNLTNNSIDDKNNTLIDNNTSNLSDQTQNNSSVQNNDNEVDDSAKSNDSDSNSWIFISIIIFIMGSIVILIVRKRRPQNSIQTISKDPVIIENNTPIPIIQDLGVAQPTILRQWTDANGYTWRQMSDRSVLWWNGHNWVPVNQNQ